MKFWQQTVFVLVGLLMVCGGARATTAYAQQEGKTCQFCHVSSSPGLYDPANKRREPVTCNEAGLYYAAHGYSLEGYETKRALPTRPTDLFRFQWRTGLPTGTRRVAVAEPVGNGSVRLITLSALAGKPDAGSLTIREWNGKTFAVTFRADVPGSPDKLAVGKFAGATKPTLIVTGGAIVFWDGKTYIQRAANIPLLGATRLNDGTERLLIVTPNAEIKAARIDLGANGNGLLTDLVNPPDSTEAWASDMHLSQELAEKLNIPPALSQAGLFGVWDARRTGGVFVYRAVNDRALNFKPDEHDKTLSEFQLKEKFCRVAFDYQESRTAKQARHWDTPNLPGEMLDIALQSPKGEKTPGLLLLTSESGAGKDGAAECGLFFFSLR